MSSRDTADATDDVPLRDLVVGEPAVHRVLDGEAARAKAEQLVREASADPRIADVVERMGGVIPANDAAGAAGGQGASVRELDASASEVQRPTARLPRGQVTSPSLDPHQRVTDPRLTDRDPSEHIVIRGLDPVGPSRPAVAAVASSARADHQRLVILGATALAVGIVLLALVLTRDPDSARATTPSAGPSTPTSTTAPPPASTPSPVATPPAPGTEQAVSATPSQPDPPRTATSAATGANPKSSSPRPPPSQDVPQPPPKPSSDRPF